MAIINRFKPGMLFAAATMLISSVSPLRADDGLAAIRNGVITFSKTEDITMQEETLTLSLDRVSADFTFLNMSSTEKDVLVAFPIPDIDTATTDGLDIPVKDSDNFTGFQTLVDGQPVKQGLESRAFLPDGKEVTATLKAHNIPIVRPYWTLVDLFRTLPETTQKTLINSGAVEGEPGDLSPRWIARSTFFFHQKFRPQIPVHIRHTYKPSLDISNMSFYSGDMSPGPEQIARYCLTPALETEIQKREAARRSSEKPYLSQFSISYILSTAKTWAGPIGRFHLIVEKQTTDQMVSFCMPMRQTSQTRFEMEKRDFVPDRDLDVVFFQ